MEYITTRLNHEQRAYYEHLAKAAIPYTDEESDNIALDDSRMEDPAEFARATAYFAMKVLAEDDELRRKEEQEKNKS